MSHNIYFQLGSSQKESLGKEKRKPIRRDPEKRRQQNIQAQKKYREKLRERLNRLEVIASSASQSYTIKNTPPDSTSLSETAITHGSSHITSNIIAKSLPTHGTSPVSVISSPLVTSRECQYLTPQSDDRSSALTSWDSTTYIDPSFLIRDKHNINLGTYWTTTVNCSCSRPHVQVQTKGPDLSKYNVVKMLSFGSKPTIADPYANMLRIETVCTIAALSNIRTYVGITEEILCAEESLSPFFRSSTELTADITQENTIFTVQRIFKTLKPDLRPSREQITIKHHPYIDILPFPTLRTNLITHQKEIDEDEFFHDILTGLVCWGNAGVGKRDQENSTGYISTGTPWDARSWEAKAWFLKKYWALLGGEDGELVHQSEWWRSIRGDDTVDMDVHN